MRIIIEINENKEASVQVTGATTGATGASMNTSRPDTISVDAGRARVGAADQGSPSMQNDNFAMQNEGASGGSGPGNQLG